MPIDFRAELNDEQYRAVTAPDGPALILAAAGTGKTRTLVYRVAYLVEHGCAPDRILLLTFTNKAAREMIDRAQELQPGTSGIWGGTFHHFSNRILRRHAERIGFPHDFTILDSDDAKKLVKRCVADRKLTSKEFPKPTVLLSLFSTAINSDSPLDKIIDERFADFGVNADGILRVHDDYQARKQKLQAMDFDDLLIYGLRLLNEHPDICARYREQFRHILVDEYQDTNSIQAELVDLLAAGHRNLMVVGDDFQSIYSWRGADFRNILSFPERYTDAAIYKLETNYRSVPEILNLANACIQGNPEQFQKELRPTREAYRRPSFVRMRDGSEQASFVVSEVTRLRQEGYKLSEMAILYRAHFHALELERQLTRSRMAYHITSGVRFFEQAHIKDVLAPLRVAANPNDEMAFMRLLPLLPGVGERTAIRIWNTLGSRFDIRDANQRALVRSGLRGRSVEPWAKVEPALLAYHEENLAEDCGELIHRFAKAFYDEYAANTFENYERRIEDIDALVIDTAKFESAEAFLSDLALLSNLDAEDDGHEEHGMLRLSTVHQAKGLEWPVVIVLWAVDGMFPSSRSLGESATGEAEERRLFYVAVTRAKDELVLCAPELRCKPDGGIIYCTPSRFIDEMPNGLLTARRGGNW